MHSIYLNSFAKTLPPRILSIGDFEILFVEGQPWAVYDGEVFYPDLPNLLKRHIVGQIVTWKPGVPQTRLPPAEFNYHLVAGLQRNLRPLLRRTNDQDIRNTQAGQEESSRPQGQVASSQGQPEDNAGS
jgi:hypothetical protein